MFYCAAGWATSGGQGRPDTSLLSPGITSMPVVRGAGEWVRERLWTLFYLKQKDSNVSLVLGAELLPHPVAWQEETPSSVEPKWICVWQSWGLKKEKYRLLLTNSHVQCFPFIYSVNISGVPTVCLRSALLAGLTGESDTLTEYSRHSKREKNPWVSVSSQEGGNCFSTTLLSDFFTIPLFVFF